MHYNSDGTTPEEAGLYRQMREMQEKIDRLRGYVRDLEGGSVELVKKQAADYQRIACLEWLLKRSYRAAHTPGYPPLTLEEQGDMLEDEIEEAMRELFDDDPEPPMEVTWMGEPVCDECGQPLDEVHDLHFPNGHEE